MSRHRFYYGWVIVAVSFLTLFMALGVRYSYGVFFVAIVREYGWSRGATAGAFSIAMISHALFAPLTGTLIDRYGPRKLFPLGAILLTLGLISASRISNLLHLYLFFGIVIAGGMGMRAQQIFAGHGIEVIVGAQPAPPEKLVEAHQNGKLETGDNVCDH